jgi:prevent-host-death family protein
MEEAVSSADANRNFSRILRGVRAGRTYVITSYGRPVARIVPVKQDRAAARAAKEALLARLRAQPTQVIGERWRRDELHEP